LPETSLYIPIASISKPNEMKVQLISVDSDLRKLCQEILAQLGCRNCHISGGIAEDPDSDLCIWDYAPEMKLPSEADWAPVRHLFLVLRKDIGTFRQTAPYPDATIILKPVTRAALTAFLGYALSADQRRLEAGEDSVRADRDELLQCLIEANLKLQEYDQDRTNFVARGIHDCRAPLTAVSGYCGLLLSGALGALSAEQKEVIGRMQQSSKRLWRMASAMVQLSAGRHQPRPELRKCDFLDCLNQALNEITPVAAGKQISITADLQPDGRSLYVEQSKIEQMLINVLDNACKFTPKFGEIEIQGYSYFWERRKMSAELPAGGEQRSLQSRQPNSYRVDIRNSGAPIAPQHIEDVFEEYTSYSNGEDRSGGGLGLAICRMFASQHDGSIWAENTDRGPRFSIVLPARAMAPAEPSERDHERSPQLVEVV
jgi:signal transduction histidine kinase